MPILKNEMIPYFNEASSFGVTRQDLYCPFEFKSIPLSLNNRFDRVES